MVKIEKKGNFFMLSQRKKREKEEKKGRKRREEREEKKKKRRKEEKRRKERRVIFDRQALLKQHGLGPRLFFSSPYIPTREKERVKAKYVVVFSRK